MAVMLIEVRPVARLRGEKAIDITPAVSEMIGALCADSVDLARVRLVCDWVQYKQNFRDVVDVRQVIPGTSADQLEVAVDLRRAGDVDLRAAAREVLALHVRPD